MHWAEGSDDGTEKDSGVEFLGIDNIHVMRESERKLKELCFNMNSEDKGWLSALENTRWLDHISLILSCVRKIVVAVDAGTSVFTHCSGMSLSNGNEYFFA